MKAIEKSAVVLIALAAITHGGPPLLAYAQGSNPNLRIESFYCAAFGIISFGSALALSVGIAIWLFREARLDGRSPWVWGLFGFVFGILAVVLYILLPMYEERRAKTGEPAASPVREPATDLVPREP